MLKIRGHAQCGTLEARERGSEARLRWRPPITGYNSMSNY